MTLLLELSAHAKEISTIITRLVATECHCVINICSNGMLYKIFFVGQSGSVHVCGEWANVSFVVSDLLALFCL